MSPNHHPYRFAGRISLLKLLAILAVLGIVATVVLHAFWG